MKKNEIIRSKLMPSLPTKLQFFTVAEVAIIVGTSTKTVHEWIDQGVLRSARLGNKGKLIRISYQDLENFIDAHVRTGELKIPDDQNSDKE